MFNYCRNCHWSREDDSSYLQCSNPIVNANNHYILAAKKEMFMDCASERKNEWYKFSPCGKPGKLFMLKVTK